MAKTKDEFKMQRETAKGITNTEPKKKKKKSMKNQDHKTD